MFAITTSPYIPHITHVAACFIIIIITAITV
jgi:hypothetical protein